MSAGWAPLPAGTRSRRTTVRSVGAPPTAPVLGSHRRRGIFQHRQQAVRGRRRGRLQHRQASRPRARGRRHTAAATSASRPAGGPRPTTRAASSGPLTDADFGSTANDQFAARANGGVRLMVGSGGWRIEPDPSSPNLIGGSINNTAGAGVYGATIAGGGEAVATCGVSHNDPCWNQVLSNYGTVGGGGANVASSLATVGGGSTNNASGASPLSPGATSTPPAPGGPASAGARPTRPAASKLPSAGRE